MSRRISPITLCSRGKTERGEKRNGREGGNSRVFIAFAREGRRRRRGGGRFIFACTPRNLRRAELCEIISAGRGRGVGEEEALVSTRAHLVFAFCASRKFLTTASSFPDRRCTFHVIACKFGWKFGRYLRSSMFYRVSLS